MEEVNKGLTLSLRESDAEWEFESRVTINSHAPNGGMACLGLSYFLRDISVTV